MVAKKRMEKENIIRIRGTTCALKRKASSGTLVLFKSETQLLLWDYFLKFCVEIIVA